tara:strand:- start:399 stop:770 length:372 start_codon:yes stop_codon:yes gene_type:complete
MAKKSWTEKEMKYFKEMVKAKRVTVLEEINDSKDKADEILKSSTANSLYSSHMADASSDHVDLERAYYMIARNKTFLGYLDKALLMIKNNTFGICQACDQLIQKERLEEVPHTTKCFDCKSNR